MTNVITAVAGYLFASKLHVVWLEFLSLIVGATLVIASACVFNNYFDRLLDGRMERTKKRALAAGTVPIKNAIILGFLLGATGFLVLINTNWLTELIMAIGFIGYVVIYGYAKRHTMHSTLIGTVPGAASLVAGYTAFSGHFNAAAAILFVIMLAWQMTHFYAIALYRMNDYAKAKMPTMPLVVGIQATKVQILFYLLLFFFATISLSINGDAGFIYTIGVAILGCLWLLKGVRGFSNTDKDRWAREIFKFSLVVIVALSVLLAVGSALP